MVLAHLGPLLRAPCHIHAHLAMGVLQVIGFWPALIPAAMTRTGEGPVSRHLCRKDNAPGRLHLALTGGSPINGVIPAGCGPLRAKVKITHDDMAGWTPGSGGSRQARAMS